MKIVVDIPDYDPNKGIQLKRNAESKLTVIIGYDDFEIGGNPRGLRSLGSCFLSLAHVFLVLPRRMYPTGLQSVSQKRTG